MLTHVKGSRVARRHFTNYYELILFMSSRSVTDPMLLPTAPKLTLLPERTILRQLNSGGEVMELVYTGFVSVYLNKKKVG